LGASFPLLLLLLLLPLLTLTSFEAAGVSEDPSNPLSQASGT
jgi:hypothetical protein